MKLTTTLLATLIFASTGAIANTTELTEQDELLIQRAETMNLHNCVAAQYNKLSKNPDRIYVLQSEFEVMKYKIEVLAGNNDIDISRHDGNSSFTVDDAAIMLIASCIPPAKN